MSYHIPNEVAVREAIAQLADANELVRLAETVVAKVIGDERNGYEWRLKTFAGQQSLEALREQQQHTLNDLVKAVNGEKVHRARATDYRSRNRY